MPFRNKNNKKIILFLFLLLLNSVLKAQIKDTSNFKKVDQRSQYLKWTPGYVFAGLDDEQIGYALASQFDYDYFFRSKISVVARVGFNY